MKTGRAMCVYTRYPGDVLDMRGWVPGVSATDQTPDYLIESSALSVLRAVPHYVGSGRHVSRPIKVVAGDSAFCRRMDAWCKIGEVRVTSSAAAGVPPLRRTVLAKRQTQLFRYGARPRFY